MWFFYLFALVPLIIGLFIWIFNKNITWMEWLGGSLTAFILAGIIHGIAFYGMTDDIETWSGRIINTSHYPQWVEEYRQRHTRTHTTGTGKNRRTHTEVYYTTEHKTHPEHWECSISFGEINDTKEIEQGLYNQIKNNFGNSIEDGGNQSFSHNGKFDGGDNKIYLTHNKTGYIYPVTTVQHFENRIKCAPTVFSFPKVPTNCPVYNWPKNNNWMVSDRLIDEGKISILEFDRMNSRLGPVKFVNVIMINFGLKDPSIANWQQAAWVGGKINDLVLCYGGINTNGHATWAKVFGWTESELVKRNLETILLEYSINNDILPLIEEEIKKSYQIKDWSKFEYISIEPPLWSYITYLVLLAITQIGLWLYFNYNEFTKINL